MDLLLKHNWDDTDHSDFYSSLRELPLEEQSKLVLMQAAQLTKIADYTDEDLLKAAESLVNFWIVRYSNSAEKGQADYLLDNIHKSLNNLKGNGI